jgi:hypothetical protein
MYLLGTLRRESRIEALLELYRQCPAVTIKPVEVEVICLTEANTISLVDNKESIEEVNQ